MVKVKGKGKKAHIAVRWPHSPRHASLGDVHDILSCNKWLFKTMRYWLLATCW